MTDAGRRHLERHEAPPAVAERPELKELSGVLALQRSAGNAAVARALARRSLQRVGGWPGVDPASPNAGEMIVTDKGTGSKARRIPIDGIPQGNVTDDLNSVAKEVNGVDQKVSKYTSESAAGGLAMVVIPVGLKLSKDIAVDVLLHLHGHTTGYRKAGSSARDINVEHIEEQVAAASKGGKRPLIAVLPQGGFKSWFGATGRSFDPTAYLDEVWKILGDKGAWNKNDAPKRGGLILSSHSGGDRALEDMLDKGVGAMTSEVADLKALFLLDTMYAAKDTDRVLLYVHSRLGRDLAKVALIQARGGSEKDQIDWLGANGFRLRGAHSGGHYKPRMTQLQNAVNKFFQEPKPFVSVLGPPGSPVSKAMKANIVIDAEAKPSGQDHDAFVGEKENLRKALEMVP